MKKHHSTRFVTLVNDARREIRETTPEEVKERLDRRHHFHLIDVREESEWAEGHLPGASHLSKGIIERDIEKAIPDTDADIVLYCGGGYRSALAAFNLQKMGYLNVKSMDGGFSGWKESGYPLEGIE